MSSATLPYSPTSLNRMIKEAIQEHRVLTFEYHQYFRRVKPFIVGRNQQGQEILSGIQFAGGSAGKSKLPSWKTFRLDEIEYPQLSDETFKPSQKDYNPKDPNFEEVYARI